MRPMSAMPRPFLRWAGSKRAVARHIVEHLPRSFGTYWEPFLGSGALFFLLQPDRAVLGDACEPLMETYRAVRDSPDDVLEHIGGFVVSREAYYEVRAQEPRDPARAAARFLYLNRTAFNGLYRVNGRGVFNVPYGRPKSATLVDDDNLRACSALLGRAGVSLSVGDFEATLDGVRSGDFVYLDPPYVTSHNDNGFIDYNQRLFSWDDQVRLARSARDLGRQGAYVVVSNADHGAVAELYEGFTRIRIERSSTLASDRNSRRRVTEALFVSER